MKKIMQKVWDNALFLEGLRQTRLIAGIMYLLLAIVIAYQGILRSFANSYIYMFVILCIFAYVMVQRLFSFQNKRNSSDMYHSMPKSKGAMYLSFGASVLIWFVIAIPVSIFLCDYISQTGVNKYISVLPNLLDSLYYMAGIIQLVGIAMFAMALTSNAVANTITTLAIIFVPRLIFAYNIQIIYELCPYLSENYGVAKIAEMCSESYNIISSLLNNINNSRNTFGFAYDIYFFNSIAVIYSIAVGVIFMIAGYLFSIRRKSEHAGKSTTHGLLQFVLRLAITMTISNIPTIMLVKHFINNQELELISVILWYLVSVFVWFIIDIITVRKLEAIKKCAAQLPALVIVNGAMCVGLVLIALTTLSNVPEEKDVEAIKIASEFANKSPEFLQAIEITDSDTIGLLVEELSEDMELFRNDYDKYMQRLNEEYAPCTIEYVLAGKNIYRNVFIKDNTENKLWEQLISQSKKEYDYEIPISNRTHSNEKEDYSVTYYAVGRDLNLNQVGQLYKSLYEELNENVYPMSMYMASYYADEGFAFLDKSEDEYNYSIPISMNMPKTMELLIEMTNKGYNPLYIDPSKEDIRPTERSVVICLYSSKDDVIYASDTYWESIEGIKEHAEEINRFNEIITPKKGEEIEVSGNLISVDLWYGYNYIVRRWHNLTDEEAEEIKEMKCFNLTNEDFVNVEDEEAIWDSRIN